MSDFLQAAFTEEDAEDDAEDGHVSPIRRLALESDAPTPRMSAVRKATEINQQELRLDAGEASVPPQGTKAEHAHERAP